MKPEDLKKYFEELERLQGPLPPPTPEEIAEFRQILEKMDGHPTGGMLTRRVIVDRLIAWPVGSEVVKEDT